MMKKRKKKSGSSSSINENSIFNEKVLNDREKISINRGKVLAAKVQEKIKGMKLVRVDSKTWVYV